MLWIAIGYITLLVSAFGIGYAAVCGLAGICSADCNRLSPVYYLFFGIMILTVYAQVISLFCAVTCVFAFLALGLSIIFLLLFYKKVWAGIKKQLANILWFEWILFVIFLVFIMFLTSLHPKQYDNYLYQAQILRYYEEYGLIKGMANINTRVGFNNSVYALMALFSYKDIYGFSLHIVNSAFCLFMGIYAIHGLCGVFKEKNYVSAGLKGAVIAYIFYNVQTLGCIGTDISAGLLGFLILILFAEETEQNNRNSFVYGLLALLIVYMITIKVSMIMLAVLILYPAFLMIKSKQTRRIVVFLLSGCVIIVPWLIRNVLITGWLLYPFPALDLFDVKWKIPYISAVYEQDLIKGWARIQTSKVYETLQLGFAEWFPIWFRGQLLRYRLLIYACVLSFVYEAIQSIFGLLKKDGEILRWLILKTAVAAGILYWLLSAPDIRFGWHYLTAFPILTLFSSVPFQRLKKSEGRKKQISGIFILCFALMISGYTFIKEHCISVLWESVDGRIQLYAFYIYQGDFSLLEVEEYKIGDDIFYYSPTSDQSGYYGFPGTTDKALLDALGYLGKDFTEGVYHKE